MYTDGDCFDPDKTKAAAKELAENPQFKCLMIGPLIVDRLELENGALKPLSEAGKLITYGKQDVQTSFDRFADRARKGN
jgi:hypothetical protein